MTNDSMEEGEASADSSNNTGNNDTNNTTTTNNNDNDPDGAVLVTGDGTNNNNREDPENGADEEGGSDGEEETPPAVVVASGDDPNNDSSSNEASASSAAGAGADPTSSSNTGTAAGGDNTSSSTNNNVSGSAMSEGGGNITAAAAAGATSSTVAVVENPTTGTTTTISNNAAPPPHSSPAVSVGGSAAAAAAAAGAASSPTRGRPAVRTPNASSGSNHGGSSSNLDPPLPVRCINPASDVNARLDTQVEVRVYPCNNSQSTTGGKKKYTGFTIKPEGVIIQGNNRNRSSAVDLGSEYAAHVGRKLQRYELSDTRACQLLVTTHAKSFWVVPAPEAFSRHSGTCRLLGDRKHPPAPHTLQVGDFLRVGSVGVVVIETHDGVENRALSEDKIQKIMKDTTNSNGGFLDLAETDGENSDDSMDGGGDGREHRTQRSTMDTTGDSPVCYMCFDEEDTVANPMITPCKCSGDTKFVHVECLRKWHTAEADNQICFLSSVDATCSVCKSTFKSDFKLRDGRQVKLFKSSLEPPYVSLLVATKHEMAQRLFNTRFQLSFSTLLKPDGRNATRPLLLGRSSGSDMVLDYRTVSARHASIRFKNGEFIFTDAGSSNGSYLYLRRPLELSPSQPVQFRLGRSMISMKVVNKWNRRLLRAVRRTGQSGPASQEDEEGAWDDRSIGSTDGDVRVTDGDTGMVTRTVQRRTRESVMQSLPPPGQLPQQSSKHLDLLYALAYPKRGGDKDASLGRSNHSQQRGGKAGDLKVVPDGSAAAAAAGGADVEMKQEEDNETTAALASPAETVGIDP